MAGGVIDPAASEPVALGGRIATLDATGTVIENGVLYAKDGSIAAVLPASADPPAGFEDIPVAHTRGTLFPGMIELHNHLPYDVLQLWPTPKKYTNRDKWSGPSTPEYRRLISGPMGVLGRNPHVVPAVVRYVEMRALLGGTTTSQGIALASNAGIVSHFRGLVRNVESTRDKDLPPATTHIADVDATDADHFLERISGRQKLILHLGEGTDAAARAHFEALHLPDGRWAISPNLVGIHCVALKRTDFKVMADHGASMVWSPLSNLLLYGATANIGAALAAKVPIALGSDWAPSGSKNLLGELKVARIAANDARVDLSLLDLVRMVTTTPAAMLGWDQHLGSLEQGKRADVIVVNQRTGNPYQALVEATEADLNLVMINGVARVGTPALMDSLGPTDEQIRIDGKARKLNMQQTTADTDVAALTVAESIKRLKTALAALPEANRASPMRAAAPATEEGPLLAVADVVDNHMSSRPHLPLHGKLTGPNLPLRPASTGLAPAAARPPEPLPALSLDLLAAVDNPGYYTALSTQPNLPKPIRTALAKLAPN